MARITRRATGLLTLAAWFGLATGVAEGVIALTLRQAGWPIRVSPEILRIAPVVDLAFFLIGGAGLMLLVRPLRLAARPRYILVIFLWVAGFILLEIVDVMRPWAALLLSLGAAVEGGRRLRPWDDCVRFARRTLFPLGLAAAALGIVGVMWEPVRERMVRGRMPPPRANAPNVLFITLDTLRADHVSAYGYARETTPNLDRLARRGVLFEDAFSNASWTLPSHASMLTGRYPHEHGADWLRPMKRDVPTIAEALDARGYLTAAFAANTSFVAPEWGLGRGFAHFEVYGGSWQDDAVRTALGRRLSINVLPRLGYFDVPGRKPAAGVNAGFFAWLDGVEGRPFFALLNYLDVHDPYVTGAPYSTRYAATPLRGDVVNFQFQPNAFRRKPALSEAEIQAEIDGYDGCLAYLDAELGRLFAELARRGLERNTLVIVTADHGEAFGNHDLFGHGNSTYLEALHVPLLVVWPGHVPADLRVAATAGLQRLPSTIVGLVDGTPDRTTFPGPSLAPLWVDPAAAAPEAVLSEVSHVRDGPQAYPTSGGSLTSIVDHEWHLITSTTGVTELFDRRSDPGEHVNLAGSEQGRLAIARLQRAVPRASGELGAR